MSSSPDPLERWLDVYLQLREAGTAPAFEDWVREHPEHADELRAAWVDWQRAARAFEGGGEANEVAGRALGPGARVGDFVLVRILGHGGQGSVWEAEQRELGRRVALKLLRPGRVSERELALFRREAQAGARLRHPNLVAVYDYDAGRAGELAWIAQELVPGGRTLRQLVDEVREAPKLASDWYPRVARLVRQIASALGTAHAAGVIHRDVKPQNVLLTPEELPKVGDFGLARIEGASALSQSGELVGTYLYMSPEQVQARRTRIDHRTDVFSLGVVLYELLTLRRPFEGDTEPQICMRILTLDPPDPRTLRSQVPADLAVICGKCMENEPDRRYATMGELAADLGRHLAHEPIHARPPTVRQRGVKWIRRHPTRSTAAALAAVAFLTISLLLEKNVRVNRELSENNVALDEARHDALSSAEEATRNATAAKAGEERATESARIANATIEFVQKALIHSDPNQAGDQNFRVVDAMDRAIRELDANDSELEPLARASLQDTIARILNGNARSEEALGLARQAFAIRRHYRPGDNEDVATSMDHVAFCLENLGRGNEALPMYEAALAMRKRLFHGDHPEVATSLNNVALCVDALGRTDEALPMYEEALEMDQRLYQGDHAEVAKSLNNVAFCLQSLGRSEEALPMYETALETLRHLFPGGHPDVARSLNNVASCLESLGRAREALPKYEEALEMDEHWFQADHPDTMRSLNNVAHCLQTLGRTNEALLVYRTALETSRRLFSGDHPNVATCVNNLGFCLHALGRAEEALDEFEAALDMRQRIYEGDHTDVVNSLNNVAACLDSLGRHDEALPLHEEALQMRKRLFPGDHPGVATCLNNVAVCLASLGRDEEALSNFEAALEMDERLFQGDHPDVANGLGNMASCLQALGRNEEALPLAERADNMAQRILSTSDPLGNEISQTLLTIYDALEKSKPGQGFAEKAAEYRARSKPPEPPR